MRSLFAGLFLFFVLAASASAASPSPAWSIHSVAEPTSFNTADAQNTVWELVVTATEGHYRLYPGIAANPTRRIEWDASAGEVQEALEALPEVGAGNVEVTGGPGDASGSKPYMITWVGALSGSFGGFLRVEEPELKDGGGAGSATTNLVAEPNARDKLAVAVVNVGSRPSEGTITITDKLPAGLNALSEEPHAPAVIEPVLVHNGECVVVAAEVTCTYSRPVLPGRELLLHIDVTVTSPSLTGMLVNRASVSGGAGSEVSTSASNPVNVGPASFGLTGFTFEPDGVGGTSDLQAGDHPYGVTTTIALDTMLETAGEHLPLVVQDVKDVAVELPLGFAGDPLAAERCPEVDLTDHEGNANTPGYHTACPPGSQVGTISVVWAGGLHTIPYPVYNVVPSRGYPAELGFNITSGLPIFLYADVVRDGSGYRLRITNPGGLRTIGDEPAGVRVEIFGDPGAVDGTGSKAAFLTNPTSCSTAPLTASTYVTSWEGGEASGEATAYPQLTGCNLLQGAAAFDPSVVAVPETSQADSPSGYTGDLRVPQAPAAFGGLATPELKDVTITLPPGVSVSPSAASGPDSLGGCQATGMEGINLGSDEVAPDGQDLGDPQATEFGAGHPGGDGSPYDDGLWHSAPGHCPENSRLGEVEVKTPDLAEPLRGHVYLAEPTCGREGRPPCTEAEAEEGKVFKFYIEVAGSGVIVKLAGSGEAGGYGAHSRETGLAPGQLRGHFHQLPQFPVEDVKVSLPGGPRAVLANPQTCGTATITSELEPWSAPESGPSATPSSSFAVTGCQSPMPFGPAFRAGTLTPLAGAYSPLVLHLTRQDGEQDLSSLSARLPEGLLAKLAGVPQCGAPEAAAGTCPGASQIGTVTAAAGAGSQPLVETGKVYLTGPYNGGPFGEVAVVPAVAGPFNFGNVVVRGSIRIDPTTAQASVVSDPFPQLVDGVPVRVKTVDVEVNRPEFTFNPTDCNSQALTGTLTAAQGASAALSSPFAVTGCANLPFKPVLTASTSGRTSRVDGASLHVKVASAGIGQANIAKVELTIPSILPSRLTTLQKACTEAQFNSNPAGCPSASNIATAVVHTPLLNSPLTGPVYFVSHGGAAFPDTEIILQGEGVKLVLDGHTQIKNGVTYSRFETVPDAPFTSFEFNAPEGPYSIFGANGNLCQTAVRMPTTITAQNGAVLKQNTLIEPEGCPNTITVLSHKVNRRTITVTVAVPGAGKLTAAGKRLTSASKSTHGRGTVTLALKAKGHGKLKTKLKLTFTPSTGKKLTATAAARFK